MAVDSAEMINGWTGQGPDARHHADKKLAKDL